MNNVDMFFISNVDKFNNNEIPMLKIKMESLIEKYGDSAYIMDFKNPIVGLVLSIFLGSLGVDRFYNGQVATGILKLITFGGFGIWTIIDWFRIMGMIRNNNSNKVMNLY